MENKNIRLFLGDCIKIMKDNIKDGEVDLILCDLPYGITACKWDTPINLDDLWLQYKRISKNNSNIILTASQPFTSILVNSNLKMFRYEWIWEKPQGTNPLQAKYSPLKNHENILVFSKKRGKYFPQMEKGNPFKGFKSDEKNIGEVYGDLKSIHKENNGTRYPKTVKKFKQDRGGLHPTQKPIELMEYLIKTYSEKNDVVLDNCMGSGTTGVACIKLNRNFIGIELDEKYFNVAKKRIESYNLNDFFK